MRKVVGVGAENSESKLFSDRLPMYAVFGNPAADGHQNFYVRSVPTAVREPLPGSVLSLYSSCTAVGS